MSSFDTFGHDGIEQLRPSDRPFDDGYMGYDPRLSSRRYDSSSFDAGSAHFIGDDDVTVEDAGNPSFSQLPFGDVVPLSNGNGNGIPYDLGANGDEIFDSDGPRFRCRIRCGRKDMLSVNGTMKRSMKGVLIFHLPIIDKFLMPCASSYYQFDEPFTPSEKSMRLKARECMEKKIAPIMNEYLNFHSMLYLNLESCTLLEVQSSYH